ncbi:MAG: DsbA family protein [Parvularculaceae bacterium]
MTNLRTAALAVLGSAVLIACGGANGAGDAADGSAVEKAARKDVASNADAPAAGFALETDMTIGEPDAPITFIEYASVTCPHCATFHETILPKIKEKYVDTGQVQFVFREFPTAPTEFALIGSVIARCAGEKDGEDAYFLVLGQLLKNQRQWVFGDDPEAELLKIANQAGMDKEAMYACLKRQEFVDLIQENVKAANEAFDIKGTPSFVVNGEKRSLRSIEDFEQAFDEILAEGANAG